MNFIGQDGLEKKDLDNNKTLIFNEFSLLQCFEILSKLFAAYFTTLRISMVSGFLQIHTPNSLCLESRQSNKYVFN